MTRTVFACALVFSAAMVAGCGEEASRSPDSPQPMATVTPPRPTTVQSSEARRKLAASKAKTDYHDAPLFPPVFAAFSEAADVDFALTEGLSKAEPIVFDLRVRTPTSVLKCLDLLADATHTKWEIRNETVVFRKSTETVDERTVLVPIPRTAR